MPAMYEVYSGQRHGKPGWATVVSGALLLLTLLGAAALSHVKVNAGRARLGEVKLYPADVAVP